jgi:acyl-CoA synthetase (AMP-forming)/AMP-acid ligase II
MTDRTTPAMPVFPPYEPTVGNVLVDGARRFGQSEFLVTPDRRLTFSDLDRSSRHLAARLVADGVGKGTKVGVLCPNTPTWLICWAAITRIGAVIVPVSTFYSGAELHRFLRHADVAYLIGVPRFLKNDYAAGLEAMTPELARSGPDTLYLPSLPQLRRAFFWEESPVAWAQAHYGAGLEEEPPKALAAVVEGMEADVTPADPMMLMYTSGTTADPKGVLHSHGAVVRHAANMADRSQWLPSYRVWTPMPLFWIGAFHSVMFRCLMAGATFLTQPVFHAAEALSFISREKVTHVMTWPPVARSLMELPSYADTDLGSMIGGSLYDRRPVDHRPPDPGLICNSLGMTETCGPYCAPTGHDEQRGVPPDYKGAYGRRVPGIEVKIADLVTGEFLPEGREGEVVVRGYNVTMGLHKRERTTSFDRDGWFHTSDRGYFRDGWLFFTGRDSDMIKTGGSNVTAAEVEGALLAYPEITDAFVFGLPHSTRGEEVVALVVPRVDGDGKTTVVLEDVVLRLRTQLSSFKVPRRIYAIARDDIPWTASQKVDRQALRDLFERLDAER